MPDSVNAQGLLGDAAVGVAATVTMDVAMVAAAMLAPDVFASEKNSPEAIGRWAAGLCRGRWRSRDVSAETPVRGELWLGLAVHYLTGTVLTQVYLAAVGRGGRRPGVPGAVAYGVATSVLPLLLMYPSMGYGCCGRQSGAAPRLVGSMLLGHAAFGAGIGLWAAATRRTG
jgi:Protein of unknown function (DUF2938)